MNEQYTIYDLARELGMTPSMVSRAFNPSAKIAAEKRKIILEEAKKHNFEPNRFASRLSMKTVKIGVLIVYKAEHVKDALINGIHSAYEKIKDYKIECSIKTVSAFEKHAVDCKEELFGFADCDGVILSGFGSEECIPLLEEFGAVNPNIVFLQNVCEKSNYLFAAKHDEVLSASLAAELIAARLHYSPRKNVILFTGDMRSSVHIRSKAAFLRGCEENGIDVIAQIDMKDSERQLQEQLPAVFEKYSDLVDGIYISSGNSVALCRYLAEQKRDITLITTDVYDAICGYIESGTVYASLYQNFPEQGRLALDGLVFYILNRQLPEKTVYTETVPVFKSNLKLYQNK